MEVDATLGLPRRHDHLSAVVDVRIPIGLVDVDGPGHDDHGEIVAQRPPGGEVVPDEHKGVIPHLNQALKRLGDPLLAPTHTFLLRLNLSFSPFEGGASEHELALDLLDVVAESPVVDLKLTGQSKQPGNVPRGTVVSSEVVALQDDPDLPQPLSAAGKELVDAGVAHVKWHVRVDNWVKGTGPQEVIIVQAHGGESSIVRIEDPAIEQLGALGHDAIQAGGTYMFWVDEYDWFKKDYYVLARAKLPTS